jgi:hypothetical protein
MFDFFNTTVANALSGVKTQVGNTTVADVKGVLSAAKTQVANTAKEALSGAKTHLSDKLKEMLKNPKIKLIEIVEKQIEEIEAFLANKIKDLDAFKENHTKVANVIIKIKNSLTDETGDTNRRVECSYYKTYEDIGNNKITTKELTLEEVEGIKALQIKLCDLLFQDNETELLFISNHIRTIDNNINSLLQTIKENRDNTNIVNELTPLLKKLQEYSYNRTLSKYFIVFKCGENGIKGLVTSKRGGSYKKTNKKNILGKERCIYKKSGDRKEYIKYKGNFIAVREYKKLLKTR